MVTNHRNLLYMLAAGMFFKREDFKKYYVDSLTIFKEHLILFREEKIPVAAINLAKSEDPSLIPCIVSFDIEKYKGEMARVSVDKGGKAKSRWIDGVGRLNKTDKANIVQLPLPVSFIEAIYIPDEKAKNTIVDNIGSVANVSFEWIKSKVEVNDKLFSEQILEGYEIANWKLPEITKQLDMPLEMEDATDAEVVPQAGTSYSKLSAVGGMYAMAYFAANQSIEGLRVYRFLCGTESQFDEGGEFGKLITDLKRWMTGLPTTDEGDDAGGILKTILDSIVKNGVARNYNECLRSIYDGLKEKVNSGDLSNKGQAGLNKVLEDFSDLMGLSDQSISILFERYKQPLSRSIITLALRDTIDSVIYDKGLPFSEEDRVLVYLIYGAIFGYLKIPASMKPIELNFNISERLYSISQPKFKIGDCIEPLGELAKQVSDKTLNNLAKEEHWDDCLQQRLSFGEGIKLESIYQNEVKIQSDYKLVVEGNNLLINGDVHLEETVDIEQVNQRLSLYDKMGLDTEDRIRRKLNEEVL